MSSIEYGYGKKIKNEEVDVDEGEEPNKIDPSLAGHDVESVNMPTGHSCF